MQCFRSTKSLKTILNLVVKFVVFLKKVGVLGSDNYARCPATRNGRRASGMKEGYSTK